MRDKLSRWVVGIEAPWTYRPIEEGGGWALGRPIEGGGVFRPTAVNVQTYLGKPGAAQLGVGGGSAAWGRGRRG